MKKFVTKLCLFLLPVIIAGLAFECAIRNIPNDYSYKKSYLDLHSKEIEYIFMGSSHSFYGINPEFFPGNAFNASHVSQSLDYDFAILNKYKNKWQSLKFIYIPISYFTMYSTLNSGPSTWRAKSYNIYYNLWKTYQVSDYFEIFNQKLRINKHRLNSYYVDGKSEISCSALGWGLGFSSKIKNDLEVFGKYRAKEHTAANDDWVETNINTLKRLVEFATERNIYLVLFTPPAYNTYYNYIDSSQMERSSGIARSLVGSCRKCVYLDLLKDDRFIAEDFYDGDHLNEIGAKKLTSILAEVVKKQSN